MMDNSGGRIPYSPYGHSGYLQQPQPIDQYPTTLPSQQSPTWPQHGYEQAQHPNPQQMWLPMPHGYAQHHQQQHHQHHQHQSHQQYPHHYQHSHPSHYQTLPSPIHHSPYDINGLPLTSPISTDTTRSTRSHSLHSLQTSGIPSPESSPREDHGRAESPGHADLNMYGFMNPEGTWSCAYPGCTSRAVFTRGCDLRKHHKRHTKSFFCRYPGCTQAQGGGFSSKKDLARHEAKHNPGVVCEHPGCDRIFSRVDNMRDHVKRIHLKGRRTPPKMEPMS